METNKAVFNNIGLVLAEQISKSKKTIAVVVAWLTSKELLGFLTDKAKYGVQVHVIISDDIINKRINPKEFVKAGGRFDILSSNSGKFLHDKFAIFDSDTVITGSYNWTQAAEYKNHESIIVSNSKQLIKQFEIKYRNLSNLVKEYHEELLLNMQNIGADEAEEEFKNLEKNLENDLLCALEESKKLHAKINFDFVYTFIKSYGSIGAAKRLMHTGTENVQSGFIKMWELDRMNLTFESIITKEKYKFLFDKKTLEIATERLKKFNK